MLSSALLAQEPPVLSGPMPVSLIEVITKVADPLMLLALVAVLWYGARVWRLQQETKRLELVPEDKRGPLVDRLANKYAVPVHDLPPSDRVALVRDELNARIKDRRRNSWFAFAAFVITALAWVGRAVDHSSGDGIGTPADASAGAVHVDSVRPVPQTESDPPGATVSPARGQPFVPRSALRPVELAFFEASYDVPHPGDRVYRASFHRDSTRYVYYSLRLAWQQQDTAVPFALRKTYIAPDGEAVCDTTIRSQVDPDVASDTWYGGCRPERGWGPGRYSVILAVDETEIAHGQFEIR